jgi:hypothetical protein
MAVLRYDSLQAVPPVPQSISTPVFPAGDPVTVPFTGTGSTVMK